MTDHVTVIIPTRNRCQLLLRTLDTVWAQDQVDLDIVVVDEGSTDETAETLARLSHDRLTVLRHDQAKGVAAARNAGIEAATGPWVAFVDDDDLWSPAKLQAQLTALKAKPTARWACAGAVRVDAQLRLGAGERTPRRADVADLLLAHNVIPGGASGVMVRTDLVRSVGGFDTALSNLADYDLWIRLGLASPLATVDRPLVGYRVQAGGMAHNVSRAERELDVVEAKYRDIRSERGVALRRDVFAWYFGSLYLRQGARAAATRVHLNLARQGHRRHRALALALLGGAWPDVQRIRDRARSRLLNPSWRQEADNWLGPLRATNPELLV